jgi:ABC-type transport system substrate-binding protein
MSAGAGAAAAAAAIAQAIKASGAIVRVEPNDFLSILQRQQSPLVVHATGGIFRTNYQYLASYNGLAFYTKSADPLDLPAATELVLAKSIWIPA